MATKNPRVNTVLEPPLYRTVEVLAKKDRVSLSQKVRDLVREALELVEDEGLESLVKARRERGGAVGWVSHAKVRRRLKRS